MAPTKKSSTVDQAKRASPRDTRIQTNKLLASLSPEDLATLQRDFEPVEMKRRLSIEKPNALIEHVYFVEHGIVSVVVAVDRAMEVEVGLIGYEGMTSVSIVHGDDRSPYSTYVQVDGDGVRIHVRALKEAMRQSEPMRRLFMKFAQTFMIQTSHTAISNAKAKLEVRLARWILMAHDRLRSPTVPLTHEFLALMLGVRRPGVTEAVHALAKSGLIRNPKSGVLHVLDRKGLEKIAGCFYGGPEEQYKRLIG